MEKDEEPEFWQMEIPEPTIAAFLNEIQMRPFVLADVAAALGLGQEEALAVMYQVRERGLIEFQTVHVPYLTGSPVPGPELLCEHCLKTLNDNQ